MAEPLSPEQRAHDVATFLTLPDDGIAQRVIASAIRAAVEAERARCAAVADDMASLCAYSRDLNPTIWDRCRNVSLDIADAIRTTTTEATHG
ncbi:hypothetical protein E6C67_08295 [Azospirillum sp. TSA2s]|uniref:hypothetical protein n=1 Tax=Azospirillum sp. TSA2s TaxID=709810 RepID=UPI0010AB44DB|nr:hypothetical protein [Azospirillum sp. TSA2s]QCG93939.1 hypothetical protein E6C67_08295 [Azospirillum sp. TSA2s]